MITRFSTLYVGHIELERCGLSGTPADDRRYPNARLAETFDVESFGNPMLDAEANRELFDH